MTAQPAGLERWVVRQKIWESTDSVFLYILSRSARPDDREVNIDNPGKIA